MFCNVSRVFYSQNLGSIEDILNIYITTCHGTSDQIQHNNRLNIAINIILIIDFYVNKLLFCKCNIFYCLWKHGYCKNFLLHESKIYFALYLSNQRNVNYIHFSCVSYDENLTVYLQNFCLLKGLLNIYDGTCHGKCNQLQLQ